MERLARELGTSKSGFYWHFKDRDELRAQMIDYWAHEFTEVVTANPAIREAPRKRLKKTMEIFIDHDLTVYEAPIYAWAEAEPVISRRLRQAYQQRLDFLRQIFSELGFAGDELGMRTRLFFCYHTWERAMFPRDSKKTLRNLLKRRVDLLSKK